MDATLPEQAVLVCLRDESSECSTKIFCLSGVDKQNASDPSQSLRSQIYSFRAANIRLASCLMNSVSNARGKGLTGCVCCWRCWRFQNQFSKLFQHLAAVGNLLINAKTYQLKSLSCVTFKETVR